MSEKMSKEQRREQYRELFKYVPGASAGDKMKWVMGQIGASRVTVKSWNAVAANPIPEAKLRLLQLKLSSHLADVAGELAEQ